VTRIVQPGHAHAIANLVLGHSFAARVNIADDLVPRHDWQLGQVEVALYRV
jgi:hypothetical protein